ncbi:protein of unknown function [Mameliella alba]|uniref:DUF4062 domain-containing protein n=1 Tax=Mameliella alba TaxID=561184 RepID=UPI000880D4C1|nr:DUF4062 domain-containing protein [Mameliella alba]OWV48220.1 hypothetical protein CDZ96_10400 [Mameliella alba]PTR40259.1 uncharacterized protein DUF4062 [Mameliella alba]GGF43540.1 hypothetical protein GCM10011319_01670 [Mameliella alba]SDC97342.1 protein of unknown function [Mameliella alba]
MPQQIDNISVFIASPGGLDEERQAAYRIVQDINRANAKHWGCQLELVGWEETLPGHGRPQSIINRDLDRCEYFIGLIYDHWGSPPSSEDTKFSSGFEEEFERARGHVANGKMKNMVVYFKEIPPERLRDPGKSLEKVINFKNKCFTEKTALYKEYTSTSDFENAARGILTEIGWEESKLIKPQPEPAASSEEESTKQLSDGNSKNSRTETSKATGGVIATSASAFVSQLLSSAEENNKPTNTDIARFRLIGCSMKSPGNDEEYLGNHDANLLFNSREQHSWSDQEVIELIKCGVAGYRDQNVPLWYWVELLKKRLPKYDYLDIMSVIGSEQVKPNAIRLSQLLGRTTPEISDVLTREDTIKNWLSHENPSSVFDAAISFLSTNGTLDDLPFLEASLADFEGNEKEGIQKAIVFVQLKEGEAKALDRVLDFEISDVGAELLDTLFSQPSSLTSELLRKCLAANDGKVRAKALALLNSRKATSKEEAESMLGDSNFAARLQAVEALHSLGNPLDEDLTKTTLTKTKARSRFGVTSPLFSLSDQTDRSYYDEFCLNRWSELSFSQLKSLVDKAGPFLGGEISILYQKFAGKIAGELRCNLADGFETFFKNREEEFAAQIGGKETDMYRRLEKLLPITKRIVVTDALKGLCGLRKRDDLPLVRDVIDNCNVDASDEVLRFLGSFGDWSDFGRITSLSGYPLTNAGILSVYKSGFEKERASALLGISRKQIADLLSENIEHSIRKEILLALTSTHLTEMSDEILLSELNREGDTCRIILALQCCIHLPKRRISKLMDRHVSRDGHRFYNTVHCLDIGASLPGKVAKSLARKNLRLLGNG